LVWHLLRSAQKISNSVTNIFNKVGCDDEGLAASLHTSGVTDRNIMDYMAVIEQRIGEIVQLFNTTQKHGITALFEVSERSEASEP